MSGHCIWLNGMIALPFAHEPSLQCTGRSPIASTLYPISYSLMNATCMCRKRKACHLGYIMGWFSPLNSMQSPAVHLHRLNDLGQHAGFRMIDVLCLREKVPRRETRLVNLLLYIQKTLWKVHEYTN